MVEGVISCDSHLVEPAEALPEGARWDGAGGVLLSLGEGYECPTLPVWAAISNGRPLVTPVGGLAGLPAAWEPKARRAWQVEQGVAAEVLYPTFASVAVEMALGAKEGFAAMNRYNDWIRHRFRPPHFWPLHLVWAMGSAQLSEGLRWAHHEKALGVLLPSRPPGGGQWKNFESAFAEAADLGLPIHWHSFSRPSPANLGKHPLQLAWEAFRPAQDILVELLLEGILARHPGLKVVFAEADYQWINHAMERLYRYGERYGQLVGWREWDRINDIVEKQVTFVVQAESELLEASPEYDSNRALWGCDFPHADAVEVEKDGWRVAQLNDRAVEVYPRIGEAFNR